MVARERDACGVGFVADPMGRASRGIVDMALEALRRMSHRGAVGADGVTGDGAGLLVPIPRRFLDHRLGRSVGNPELLGVVGVFIPPRGARWRVCAAVERAAAQEGLAVWGWRTVPVDPAVLGPTAASTCPRVLQAILRRPSEMTPRRAEHHAHRMRRRIEIARTRSQQDFYVISCSFHTVTYKALITADRLSEFYPDLADPDFSASFAIVHQRFATNTASTWERTQPFRTLCHNGEINTIDGNVHRMRARAGRLGLGSLGEEALFDPPIRPEGSDSAILDEVAELLIKEGDDAGTGRDVRRAIAMLVPAAWEHAPAMSDAVRGFYRWHQALMEPWDGPAALVFTDGVAVGAAQDRNGLRPMRIAIHENGPVVCASEAGVIPVDGRTIVQRRRLGPGQMIVVDPENGGIQLDPVGAIAERRPYAAWAATHLMGWDGGEPTSQVPNDLSARQVVHGFTREDLTLIMRSASRTGHEPTFSMGDDTAVPPMATTPRPVFSLVRQRFAQVTNPAIDHVRERSVMSLRIHLGPRAALLSDRPEAASLIDCPSFFLWQPPLGRALDASWPVDTGPRGLGIALDRLAKRAVDVVGEGAGIVIVGHAEVGPSRAPIPSLVAVGAINRSLTDAGLRSETSIVADVDDVRGSHDAASLIAMGAEGLHPRLTIASVAAATGNDDPDAFASAVAGLRSAMEEGVLKAMARLGIASVDSYRGTEALDVIGLAPEVVERIFCTERSAIGGKGFEDLGRELLLRHRAAFDADLPSPANPGLVKSRRGGDHHANDPSVVRAVHRLVDPSLSRLRTTAAADDLHGDGGSGEAEDPADRYRRFAGLVAARPPTMLRDLLEIVPAPSPSDIGEVEPIEAILTRFSTAAMSHGSISAEAHETLAEAMSSIGGRANSGEGGEDPARFRTDRNCAIKQIASGRFGVTPEYCSFADELQIKIAQGSKPGEGGQLPGHKVTEEIARLRHTQAGVSLISPAPHHDIYSIEDLAQLIFDLRQVNPTAEISVKLVAEDGIGAVAVGVVKAGADIVHVAGASGGTGASPLVSIKHVGMPWETGLSEVHHSLIRAGLRRGTRVRVDGGLLTGSDVVIAALLGADEFSFGTAALLAEGCLMVRTCHLDTCPAGIATQRPELRAKFAGTPSMVADLFRAIAGEVRDLLAHLGATALDQVVGCSEHLRIADRHDVLGASLGLGSVLEPAHAGDVTPPTSIVRDRPRSALGDRVLHDVWPTIQRGNAITREYRIENVDRAVGASLGGAIGRAFGARPPQGTASIRFHGSAGQSFGAFLSTGVDFHLRGEANDHVGKGMAGGQIVIVPPADDGGDPCLAGNAVLYGATGGSLYIAGTAGERFAVRNSGAVAVVEGIGEHGCEYMTGGTVVILGPVGANLAAGMTGGELFVLTSSDSNLESFTDTRSMEILRLDPEAAERYRSIVVCHAQLTGSAIANAALKRWGETVARTRSVVHRTEPTIGAPDAPGPQAVVPVMQT